MTLIAGRAQATLFDRGNGLVYDDFDNLSWTQNAAISGLNDWASQKAFADNLVFAGFDDFILVTLSDLEGLYLQLPGPNGSNKTGAQEPFTDIQSTYWSRTEIMPAERRSSASSAETRPPATRTSSGTVGRFALEIRRESGKGHRYQCQRPQCCWEWASWD